MPADLDFVYEVWTESLRLGGLSKHGLATSLLGCSLFPVPYITIPPCTFPSIRDCNFFLTTRCSSDRAITGGVALTLIRQLVLSGLVPRITLQVGHGSFHQAAPSTGHGTSSFAAPETHAGQSSTKVTSRFCHWRPASTSSASAPSRGRAERGIPGQ